MKAKYIPHKSTRYVNIESSQSPKEMPKLYDNRENCCGCSACYAICPVHAIVMEPDNEGFLYPMVDATKCIHCYQCLSVCVFKADQERHGYLARGGVQNG